MEKIWSSQETMDGSKVNFGFLFLYSLLTGDIKAKVLSGSDYSKKKTTGGYVPMMNFKNYSKQDRSAGNDSHRFAVLMAQMYSDKNTKGLPASVINVLCRNRQVALRMPKFNDNRKETSSTIFNGWVDEVEPNSPIADLFAKLAVTMSALKAKGAFHFPPPPPHPELPAPPTSYQADKNSLNVFWKCAALSDYGNAHCSLSEVSESAIRDVLGRLKYRLTSDTLRPTLPVNISDSLQYERFFSSNTKRLVAVFFYTSYGEKCKVFSPVFRYLSLSLPVLLYVKVCILEVTTCHVLCL